ncbi:uncharacterized protein LACBIDRAFT_314468 [Laccaria bicolor S238N-H82]|uniref:DNA 3'-5' helicase n=1 Tax=Laccaria bicolor (strain S238N-H82 / ATCC MYA-4686) TaxID=486041 RepID=B0DYM0_LACBS|nr:uncharacterized protein LACBIDRAFT_314468 [Laccaria bicolor S238N-H82]EDR00269.1 predicted protein [Laccaria bicolor S238N-H82]|eukprot:XP_001889021.1 predicted protein [Laccaria bicolor S238N-H82]
MPPQPLSFANSQPHSPTGTQHKVKSRRVLPTQSSNLNPEQRQAIDKELERLPELVKAHFTGWGKGPQAFQLAGMRAQALSQDVLLHAATGAGKMGIAAGPHLLPSSTGKVTLMVSPLLSLQEEQVITFQEEFKLKAVAINSNNGGCTKDVMEVGFAFSDTPIVAVTATLTPQVHEDLINKLQFDREKYLFINEGNERSNVAQIVRAMEHPMDTYHNLDFLIPDNMTTPLDIKKSFIYADDITGGAALINHLNSQVKEEFQAKGLVCPYNTAMSTTYRKLVLRLFKEGVIRILVCTDAAGMGCNIPDVDSIVQWKAPSNLSSWVQRVGQAAWAAGGEGLAVMIVEKSAFEISTTAALSGEFGTNTASVSQRRNTRGGHGRGRSGRGRGQGRPAKNGPTYGVSHGAKCGQYSGAHDTMTRLEEHEKIPGDAVGEGLYWYIQTTVCHRLILTKIFRNKPSYVSPTRCCDLCNPKLFDRTHPSKPIVTARQRSVKKGEPVALVRDTLYAWRRSVKCELYPRAMWAPQALLDDPTCELLSSVGPIQTKEHLASLVESSWARWSLLSDILFNLLVSLKIPSLARSKCTTTASKRSAPTEMLSSALPATLPKQLHLSTHHESGPSTSIGVQKSAIPSISFGPSAYDSFFSHL